METLKELSNLVLVDELRKQYLRNIELINEVSILTDTNEIKDYRIKKLEDEILGLKRLVLNLDIQFELKKVKDISLTSLYV